MRNTMSKAWRLFIVSVVGVAACVVSLTVGSQDGLANGDRNKRFVADKHQSTIHLSEHETWPIQRDVRVGLGKSVLVVSPRGVRDVMVSNPLVIDAVVLDSNRVFLMSRLVGEANAFLFDENGEQFATLELYVERESGGLQSLLNRVIPGSDIKVEMINQSVVLTGSVRNPADSAKAANIATQFVTVEYETKSGENAEGVGVKRWDKADNRNIVINMLKVEGEEQVMLKVIVAEVQRSMLKQFGINIGADINAGNFVTGILSDNALPLTTAAGLGNIPVAGFVGGALSLINDGRIVNDQASFNSSGINTRWSTAGDNPQSITGAMRALERTGLVRMLAEPNLTAISGEPAKFLAGGEFPIPVIDSQGQINVEFKEFGVGVSFTPIVLSAGRISLKIETEVSELTNIGAVTLNGIGIPALNKREANSTVELPSGGSLAMAGLLSEDTRQNIDGFPGLKDVPILGTLFRSRDFERQETELVVIVTPYLVRPTSRKELALPTDGLAAATDKRANLLGEINRIYGRGRPVPEGGLKGDFGFIVE